MRARRGGVSHYSPMSIPLLSQWEIHVVNNYILQEEKEYFHRVLLVILAGVGKTAPEEAI